MTTQNHSVLLHRLSRTIDANSKTNSRLDSFYSETIKLPALNAINKSVKYNDISFSTSRRNDKLRKQPDQPENIEQIAAHYSFMTVRKKYDDMKKIKEEHALSISILEIEKQKYQTQKNKFVQQKNQGEKKVKSMLNSLNNIKFHLEECDIDKKIMLNMVSRLKSDKIVYDLRKYNYQKKLSHFQKHRQMILKESTHKKQEQDNTKQVYSKFIDHLSAEKTERQLHINSLSTMIQQKQSLIENGEIRKNEMKDISEATLQDKDFKEKNWYRIYLCHQFVSRLLRDKMTRQMNKFNTVEMAYKNIKTTTGVSNTQELVKKFLSKEGAYGQLLGKIAQDEKHIQQLNAQKKEINRERKKITAESDNLNINKKQTRDLSKQQKELHAVSQIAKRYSMNLNKLSSWIGRNSKKLNIQYSQSEYSSLTDHFLAMKNNWIYIFQKIEKNLEETKVMQLAQYQTQTVENQNNVRITIKEQSLDYQDNNPNENDEEDYMNKQHQEMIRNNEKFMKDIKKKYEQIKMIQLQQEPKKKQIVVEKPKILQVQQN